MSISPIAYLNYNLKVIEEVIRKVGVAYKQDIELYLDLGCGSCTLTEFVANIIRPRQVICVDIDLHAVETAKKRGYTAYRLDLNEELIPLADNSVDFCTAFEIIEHLWNKDHFLEEVYRVLKHQGFFIISTPNMATWVSRFLLLLGKPPLHYDVSMKYFLHKPSYGHISLYTPSLLIKHLEAIGFKLLTMRGLLMPWAFKNKVVSTFTKVVSKIKPTLAPAILIVAKKA